LKINKLLQDPQVQADIHAEREEEDFDDE